MQKGEWKDYFTFTKGERTAVFILLGLMAVFIFFAFVWQQPVFTKPVVDEALQKQLTAASQQHRNTSYIDSTDEEGADSTKETYTVRATENKPSLFYFDPNTLDSIGWRRLGFGEKTVEHILEYRKAKGRFGKPDDLYNVTRIRKKNVAAVIPYMRMGSGLAQASPQNKSITAQQAAAPTVATTAASFKIIYINKAVAEDFKAFPGVSFAVAARIIKYRSSLNGFTSVDDVAKTYGLADSTFKMMRPYLRL